MAGLVGMSILTAHKALRERRAVLALQVINGDARIDRLEETIEDGAIDRLTKQPVAAETHRLVTVLMVNRELERIGDLAESIGRAVIELDADHPPIDLDMLSRMFLFAEQGMEKAMPAFLYRREDLAIEVVRSGPQIGPLRDAVQASLVRAMSGGSPAIAKMIPPPPLEVEDPAPASFWQVGINVPTSEEHSPYGSMEFLTGSRCSHSRSTRED